MSAGGYFQFDGKSSRSFGILVDSVEGIWDSAERDTEQIEIPGRSGDLIIDNGRWKNVTGKYKCGIGVDFQSHFEDFRSYMTSRTGYKRLVDSWHPGEYRMAKLIGRISPQLFRGGIAGEFDVSFTLKPQRFLKSGDNSIIINSSSDTITNPSEQTSKPLLRVYGTGTFSVGGTTMQITDAQSYTDIDCDICECYRGSTADNRNSSVKLLSGSFPELHAGSNGIRLGSGITSIVITPRWWKL